jgi:precorrin-6Y C5,15-methyltransferase (decarboxylating) CbiT subunit
MITKVDIRVLALSKMRLERDSVVWDIGAGSGSVAVEAALIADVGTVYAIEKDAKRVRDILKNRERFRAWNMEVINGRAPGCLKARSLPAPDAVFVGGGGKGLSAILDYVAGRIKTGGRVVVNAVTIETAYRAFGFFKVKGFSREMTLVGVSKVRAPGAAKARGAGSARGAAKGASELNMLSADNPVFIIVGVRHQDGRS